MPRSASLLSQPCRDSNEAISALTVAVVEMLSAVPVVVPFVAAVVVAVVVASDSVPRLFVPLHRGRLAVLSTITRKSTATKRQRKSHPINYYHDVVGPEAYVERIDCM